jgi:zinc dependent phospholipase C
VWIVWAVLVVFWPDPAHAWALTTHLDFGLDVVRGAFLLAPGVRALVEAHTKDYLYGCVAADIIVGKNRASYDIHSHNWKAGLKLLKAAANDDGRALAYGFLSHLAADTVAHNYFVPYKIVESFRSRATHHTYWELRFERIAHEDQHVWEHFRALRKAKFHAHDGFLERELQHASRLFTFAMSRRIFRSAWTVMGMESWRKLMRNVGKRSLLPLGTEEATEYRALALEAVQGFLREEQEAESFRVDPVGARSLAAAHAVRKTLRRMHAERNLEHDRLPETMELVRRGFRETLHGRLVLPDVESALHRSKVHRPRRTRRPTWMAPPDPDRS